MLLCQLKLLLVASHKMLEDAERYACLQQRVVGEDDLVGMLGVPVAYKIPVVFARVPSGEAIVAAAVADYVWLISTVVGEVRRRLLGKIVGRSSGTPVATARRPGAKLRRRRGGAGPASAGGLREHVRVAQVLVVI